ncbi:class I SAM-dependent methyltransferase [Cohaesibacter marisflavi]|uniref:class I SAM-dependent methyltransferase n=1 Tax=Cohaesibacter marisflavi TaxID=655353 RepID=UPI0029C9640C|nr:class I SAM-dependent methyltransferase [Cohaesibacter marisflavi]
MSGFDKEWLALREPADRAARDRSLITDLSNHISQKHLSTIIDIGCGTGSTWRALAPRLPSEMDWLLLDYDAELLATAKEQIGSSKSVSFHQFDLNDLDQLPMKESAIVTASAFFDLASPAFCKKLIDMLKRKRCGLYAALNYDGTTHWSHSHPLDSEIIALFNRHQRTDKGFGDALGPEASVYLAELLRENNYLVKTRPSPWHISAQHKDLERAFLQGFPEPIRQMGTLEAGSVKDWLSYRLDAIEKAGSLCTVGHTDLIALPI